MNLPTGQDELPVGFSAVMRVGEIKATINTGYRFQRKLSVEVEPNDSEIALSLFGALSNWAGGIEAPNWQQKWYEYKWIATGLLFLLLFMGVFAIPLSNWSVAGKSVGKEEARKLLASGGVTANNERRALELLLAIESNYNTPGVHTPSLGVKYWSYVSLGTLILFAVTIYPGMCIGLWKGKRRLDAWRAWMRILTFGIPTLLGTYVLLPWILYWLRLIPPNPSTLLPNKKRRMTGPNLRVVLGDRREVSPFSENLQSLRAKRSISHEHQKTSACPDSPHLPEYLLMLLSPCQKGAPMKSLFLRLGFSAVAVFMSVGFTTQAATGTYDAGLGTLPEAQGWAYTSVGANPSPFVSGGALHAINTAGGQYWLQVDSSIDFSQFVFEANLRVDSSNYIANVGTGTREGYYLAVRANNGEDYTIGLASGGFNINTIQVPNNPLTSFAIADGNFHTYRLSVQNHLGSLFIDGIMVADNIPPSSGDLGSDPEVLFGGESAGSRSDTELKVLCYNTTSSSSCINLDTTPPVITVSAYPSLLWPPNGKMVNVTVSGTITDATSGVNPNSATFTVVDSYGTVQPTGNVTINGNGSYSFMVSLEALRSGNDRKGRTYTITVTGQDNAGNQTSTSTTVVVPHDQGN